MKNTNEEEIEIDLLDLFSEICKRWKFILLSLIYCAAIGYFASTMLIIPKYESTSALYVLSKSTSITSLTDIQMGTNLTNDYIVVVAGRPVLEQVIKNLDLDVDYKQLSDMIQINNPSNSRILEITVTSTSPDKSKLIADELANVAATFISDKMDQDPPSIIQTGYADDEQVSPKVAKNTALGGLIGIALAILVIFISYTLNDTIVTSEDVERKLGLHVLGTLPLEEGIETDAGHKKRFLRGANK